MNDEPVRWGLKVPVTMYLYGDKQALDLAIPPHLVETARVAKDQGLTLVDPPTRTDVAVLWVSDWFLEQRRGAFIEADMARKAGYDAKPTMMELRFLWETV